MKKETKKNNNTLIAGAIAGVIAAATAGYLLFGPNGESNRKKINDWMIDAKNEIVSQLQKAKAATKEEFGDVIDSVMEQYTEAKEITVHDAREFRDELLESWDDLAFMIMKGKYKEAEDLIVMSFKTKAFSAGKKIVKNLTEEPKKIVIKKVKKPSKKTVKSKTEKISEK